MGRLAYAAGAGLVSVVVALPAVALAAAHAGADHRVLIRSYLYSPARLSIRRGDTVTWVFDDGTVQHNVIGGGFRSSPTLASGTFTVRFTRVGTFRYTCTLHPWMAGSVLVHR